MSKSEKRFERLFRIQFIIEKEQNQIRKALNNPQSNKQVIELTKRYDILQRRKERIRAIKLKF